MEEAKTLDTMTNEILTLIKGVYTHLLEVDDNTFSVDVALIRHYIDAMEGFSEGEHTSICDAFIDLISKAEEQRKAA